MLYNPIICQQANHEIFKGRHLHTFCLTHKAIICFSFFFSLFLLFFIYFYRPLLRVHRLSHLGPLLDPTALVILGGYNILSRLFQGFEPLLFWLKPERG